MFLQKFFYKKNVQHLWSCRIVEEQILLQYFFFFFFFFFFLFFFLVVVAPPRKRKNPEIKSLYCTIILTVSLYIILWIKYIILDCSIALSLDHLIQVIILFYSIVYSTWVTHKFWYMAKGHPQVGWAPIGFAVVASCTNLPEVIVLGIVLGWAPIGFAAMATPRPSHYYFPHT